MILSEVRDIYIMSSDIDRYRKCQIMLSSYNLDPALISLYFASKKRDFLAILLSDLEQSLCWLSGFVC